MNDFKEEEGYFRNKFFQNSGVLAAFSTRKWNLNFKTKSPQDFKSEEQKFAKILQIPLEALSYFNQVHGNHVVLIDQTLIGCGAKRNSSDLIKADGALTSLKQVPLMIFTADCAPIFFFDSAKRAIGIVHAGWRGAHLGIGEQMISNFVNQFKSKVTDLQVAIGPLIHSCCYEVGPEFQKWFGLFVTQRKNCFYFDLNGFIVNQLIKNGIDPNKIISSDFCTSCEKDLFFSYRRDGAHTGRIASVIMLT